MTASAPERLDIVRAECEPSQAASEHTGTASPMIEASWVAAAGLPKRVVVEFSADEYQALEAACRGRCITAPKLVRLVALRLARAL